MATVDNDRIDRARRDHIAHLQPNIGPLEELRARAAKKLRDLVAAWDALKYCPASRRKDGILELAAAREEARRIAGAQGLPQGVSTALWGSAVALAGDWLDASADVKEGRLRFAVEGVMTALNSALAGTLAEPFGVKTVAAPRDDVAGDDA